MSDTTTVTITAWLDKRDWEVEYQVTADVRWPDPSEPGVGGDVQITRVREVGLPKDLECDEDVGFFLDELRPSQRDWLDDQLWKAAKKARQE